MTLFFSVVCLAVLIGFMAKMWGMANDIKIILKVINTTSKKTPDTMQDVLVAQLINDRTMLEKAYAKLIIE